MHIGPLHLHRRKRIHKLKKKVNEYPNPDPKVDMLDRTVSVISVIFPLTALPQVYTIWVLKETSGVSLITWSLFLCLNLPLLAYAIIHKDKRLTTMWGLWTCIYLAVVVGLII